MASSRTYALKSIDFNRNVQAQVNTGDLVVKDTYYGHEKTFLGVVEGIRHRECLIRGLNGTRFYRGFHHADLGDLIFINLRKQTVLVVQGSESWYDLSRYNSRNLLSHKEVDELLLKKKTGLWA